MKRVAFVSLALAVGISLGLLAQGLTADEILARVEEGLFMGGGVGSTIATVKFDVNVEGETTSYTFRVYSRHGVEGEPDKTLVVYLAPELVAGTMFLTWAPEEGDARIWLYLPALGLVRELIAPRARQQEFVAGSGITWEELAEGFEYRDDYSPELIGEETVGGLDCYVLLLTPLEGRATPWGSIKLWVEKEHFVLVRSEFYDTDGELVKTMVGDDLYEDEVGYIPRHIVLTDLVEGSSSTISILEREAQEIPPEYFDPEQLPTLEL